MENASRWTCSPTAVNAKKVTAVLCVTSKENSLTRAEGYSANMAGARFQTRVMRTATARMDTLGNCVIKVRNETSARMLGTSLIKKTEPSNPERCFTYYCVTYRKKLRIVHISVQVLCTIPCSCSSNIIFYNDMIPNVRVPWMCHKPYTIHQWSPTLFLVIYFPEDLNSTHNSLIIAL